MKILKLLASTVLSIGLVSLLAFPLISQSAVSYRVNGGGVKTINEHSVCWDVWNSSGNDVFVPTNTSLEWTTFIANPPAGITFSACGPWTYFKN